MLPWILLSALGLSVALTGERLGRPRLIWLGKPLASAGFIAAAAAGGALDTAYGNAVLLALAWSMLGDVLLIPRDTPAAFVFGLVAFLVGHLGYLVAFRVLGLDGATFGLALAGLLVPAAAVLRWLWPHLPRRMRAPVLAYVAVITAMVAGAIGTWPAAADPAVLVAASLFYLSDLAVARHRFVAPALVNRLVGLPLYYAAQFVFVATATSGP